MAPQGLADVKDHVKKLWAAAAFEVKGQCDFLGLHDGGLVHDGANKRI